MADPMERQRERELERRRENELEDLEVENEHAERPLEGLSSAMPDTQRWASGFRLQASGRTHVATDASAGA